jgi:hypothetical protein
MSYISEKKTWVRTDGWRGYEQPINAVGGANNTGTWSDSPCPTHVALAEIEAFRKQLRKVGIRSKLLGCATSNVFCQHIYVLVHPENRERAYEIAKGHENDTRLFYAVSQK